MAIKQPTDNNNMAEARPSHDYIVVNILRYTEMCCRRYLPLLA